MKKINKKYQYLMVIGAILLTIKILTKHFVTFNMDGLDFAQGMGAGIILMTLINMSRDSRTT